MREQREVAIDPEYWALRAKGAREKYRAFAAQSVVKITLRAIVDMLSATPRDFWREKPGPGATEAQKDNYKQSLLQYRNRCRDRDSAFRWIFFSNDQEELNFFTVCGAFKIDPGAARMKLLELYVSGTGHYRIDSSARIFQRLLDETSDASGQSENREE